MNDRDSESQAPVPRETRMHRKRVKRQIDPETQAVQYLCRRCDKGYDQYRAAYQHALTCTEPQAIYATTEELDRIKNELLEELRADGNIQLRAKVDYLTKTVERALDIMNERFTRHSMMINRILDLI